MKCSMMFKRGFVLLLALAAVFGLASLGANAQQAEIPGDILLLHDRILSEDAAVAVEKLVTLGAAMGKVVDYGTPEQCAKSLDRYSYVICCDLQHFTPDLEKALKSTSANLMMIGAKTMAGYLRLTGNADKIIGTETQKNGSLRYTFPTGQTCEGIVRWEQLYRFESDGYESGTIQAGAESYPFCTQVAGARVIPICDMRRELTLCAVTEEIVQWLWPYNDRPRDYAQFLVLDSVYPFMSAQSLMEIVEEAEEIGVPYVISVMPLTANYDYPAMTQFCQVLAYAQNKGAAIILHAPIIHKTVEDSQELYEKLTDMTRAYMDNGVYPLGIQVPLSWINQEPYLTVLKRYSTVFVYDDGGTSGFDLDAHTSLIARQGHQLVYPMLDLEQEGLSQLECFPTAAYADCGEGKDVFLRYAGASKTAGKPYLDLRDYNHSVWVENGSLLWRSRSAYVDGKLVDTTFQPVEYDTQFDYHRSALTRISVDLKNQNRFLMVVVLILSAIFISFIAYARRRMRKRFFSAPGDEKE